MIEFKPMSDEDLNAAVEGQPNILARDLMKEEALFRHTSCPSCGQDACEAFPDPHKPFDPGSTLPRRLLRCATCRTEFNPYTGLVTLAAPPIPGV